MPLQSDARLLVTMDLEGCLVPEIWIAVAHKMGIEELLLTTREINDYNQLMQHRLQLLDRYNIKLQDIQAVIEKIDPLPGAQELVDWLRSQVPFIILSDSYYEFAMPLIKKLGYPTLFCHALSVERDGRISSYRLRGEDSKRSAVRSFQENGFFVVSVGDAYNDLTMLQAADSGYFLHAPEKLAAQYSQISSCRNYDELTSQLKKLL